MKTSKMASQGYITTQAFIDLFLLNGIRGKSSVPGRITSKMGCVCVGEFGAGDRDDLLFFSGASD